MGDEGLDQFAAGTLQSLRTAEIGGIGLDQCRIKVVLADQEAELVAETGLAITRTVSTVRTVRSTRRRARFRRFGKPTQFLDRAEADPVRLSQGSVDSSSFGHPHLRAADQGRCISGIGVTITDETF